jgi:hypothetical protein
LTGTTHLSNLPFFQYSGAHNHTANPPPSRPRKKALNRTRLSVTSARGGTGHYRRRAHNTFPRLVLVSDLAARSSSNSTPNYIFFEVPTQTIFGPSGRNQLKRNDSRIQKDPRRASLGSTRIDDRTFQMVRRFLGKTWEPRTGIPLGRRFFPRTPGFSRGSFNRCGQRPARGETVEPSTGKSRSSQKAAYR